jgi:succinylarginine dihydrolase
MKALADAGFPQAVIPPQERPNVLVLRQLGFSGSDEQVIEKAATHSPHFGCQLIIHVGVTRRRSVPQPMRSTGGCI